MKRIPPDDIDMLQHKVLSFYREHGRVYPWRKTTDRYAVMVSEIMLQQTQADRVVGKYLAWMERYPDPASLAASSLKEVLCLWSGLGYNARGERLQRAADIILRDFDGQVPGDPELLMTLPGIGPYTSRSIPVFADNMDIAAVDTNIRRILIVELGLDESTGPKQLMDVARAVLPAGRSREWHNALMDYGALVLTARRTGIRPVTRQSRFEGSRRWYRSRILRDLLEHDGGMTTEEISARYADCPYDLDGLLDELEKDRLIEQEALPDDGGVMVRVRA
ncbi:Fe-S cluster assembly protein HesB [Prosthecochloris sp. N3]|uniref:Fe-S cluster assembly protein HesB n=1 Tax=Prosthecochloris ethylica TaxID=2743976 RepID=A0ABR9XPU2_9CHLB|nr:MULTISPECIES: Fe-S cluster assembly protein HesB [Prosthecochloris]MEC9486337.1 Fe-S cluster assembly protein HesB [Prosthecochloris sp.]MBF0586196.1 Fe-S cluster assembly protein HesB [Prosthecochloris ethylica]MBF0635902.1 Fe-S cluster assembly protein HesB [Prosthecochloris ethylica]NUK47423.1 Fe-S cluster assembly protein HesB [Prosthecochloris ethylica]RNA64973.1 Fe-S cluster assembly protein HesB [Prosthecochloris sp. ZM_2]